MDKALQMMDVHDDRLQAVAMACLLIAGEWGGRQGGRGEGRGSHLICTSILNHTAFPTPTSKSFFLFVAKYEEKEEACPTANMLVNYAVNELVKEAEASGGGPAAAAAARDRARERWPNAKIIHQMEVLLLTRLNWTLSIVTPLHYMGLFHRKVSPFSLGGGGLQCVLRGRGRGAAYI